MTTFDWIIALLIGAVTLAALARRTGIPYPTFLAVGGMLLAFLPGTPAWTLQPELALALFVAPVLLDAAYDTSLRDLRANWLPVTTLVFAAVAVTTACVALVAHTMVPDLPWPAAIALGAIVAPPDAAAATTILRQVKLPHRIVTILEGESLLNDASALLIYRITAGIVMMHHVGVETVVPTITLALAGSLVAGYVCSRITMHLFARVSDVPSAIILQFATTFTIWIVAEHLGLSGILTIVAYAIIVARTAPARTSARLRVPTNAVWETAVFLLNVLAFVLIGMQLGPIWQRMNDATRRNHALVAGAVLVTVIASRIAWVMSYNTVMRLKGAYYARRGWEARHVPMLKSGLVVAWCGMRGIVTLASAFALPEQFPHRDLMLLIAFAVVLGTLLIQGLTLRPLVRLLSFAADNPVEQEVAGARIVALRAALDAISADPSEEAEVLRLEYDAALLRAETDPASFSGELPADPMRRRAIDASRQALIGLRANGVIGDDAFHRLEEELDWAELSAQAGT
ncbi:MAG: sodium:proton antiporter [Pseudomonadota bacterium]